MRKNRRLRLNLISGDAAATGLLGVFFLLGGLCGCLAAGFVDGGSGAALDEYLKAYLALAQERGSSLSTGAVAWDQLRFPLAVVLLGFTAVGLVCIPAVFCVRGFLFSFSAACFVRVFGLEGLVPAAVLFGIPALLWTPAFLILGVQGMTASYGVLRRCRGEGGEPVFFWRYYLRRCVLCAGLLTACGVLTQLLLPELVGASAGFVL